MTAARGIVHAEYQEREFARRGGILHGIQLWVNLPAREKTSAAAYQDIPADRIPDVRFAGGSVRVIAGDLRGARGPARTRTPMLVTHVRLTAGAETQLQVPAVWNTLAYVIAGHAQSSTASLRPRQMAVFANTAAQIELSAVTDTELLVLAGEPIDEPA